MKRFLTIMTLLMSGTALFAQVSANDSLQRSSGSLFQPKKYDFGVNMGSSFTTLSHYGSALTTFVTPHVDYNLSKRFRISGGFSVSTTNYFDVPTLNSEGRVTGTGGNFTTATLFVSGLYQVNDRLSLTGSAFKIFPVTQDPLPYNPFNPISRNGAQGVDFNVGYRIGRNVHIQAGFRYTEGVNPYYGDPFGGSSRMSDPFRQGSYGIPRW